MNNSNKILVINELTNKYFVESYNPLLNFGLRYLGYQVTKSDMKLKLIQEEIK